MLNKIKEKLEKEICALLDKQPLTKEDVCLIGELTDALKDVSTAGGMDAYGVKYLDMDESYAIRMPHLSYADVTPNQSYRRGRYMSMDEDPAVHHAKFSHGYSGHSVNDRMIASLEHLVDQTEGDYERQQIINEIESLRKR